MEPTTQNYLQVLSAPPPQLRQNLPIVFAKLLQPDQDDDFLIRYTGAIKERFTRDKRPTGQLGFDSFAQACLKTGLVKTMLTLTQIVCKEENRVIASYNALQSLQHLIKTGSIPDRRILLAQMMENDIVEICVDKAMNHPFCIHRHLGVTTLRRLAAECFLGDKLSATQSSDVMIAMCRFILQGPGIFVEQMASPQTTWQSCMLLGSHGIPSWKSVKHAPRYYAMAQESASWTMQGLLCAIPPKSRAYCHDLLSHNPTLIDLLFECSTIVRPAAYPETQFDSVTCEVLAMLFLFPQDVVPGVSVSLDENLKTDALSERESMIKSLKILTSRTDWMKKVLAVWKKVDDEKWQDIKTLFGRVKTDYLAMYPPDEDAFRQLFEYRGVSRISMLRIITTLTHFANECDVPDWALLSFLRLGYLGSQKVKSIDQLDPFNKAEHYIYIERAMEVFRSPMYTVDTGEQPDPPVHVADEAMMGPTTLIRLLVVLAQRGLLQDIPQWTSLPAGTLTTSIGQVKQITSAAIVQRVVTLALKRVVARREKGKNLVLKNDLDYARAGYMCAAELAAALVALDAAGQVRAPGARKELVFCLGNAAEMALRLGQHRRALTFALGALDAENEIPAEEGLEKGVIQKNVRRVEVARKEFARSRAF